MATTLWPGLPRRWGVTDLLARSIRSIMRHPDARFRIVTTSDELPRMRDVRRGPSLRRRPRWSPAR